MKFQWEKKSFVLGVLAGALGVAILYFGLGLFRGPAPFPSGYSDHGMPPGGTRSFQRDPSSMNGARGGSGGGSGFRAENSAPANP